MLARPEIGSLVCGMFPRESSPSSMVQAFWGHSLSLTDVEELPIPVLENMPRGAFFVPPGGGHGLGARYFLESRTELGNVNQPGQAEAEAEALDGSYGQGTRPARWWSCLSGSSGDCLLLVSFMGPAGEAVIGGVEQMSWRRWNASPIA